MGHLLTNIAYVTNNRKSIIHAALLLQVKSQNFIISKKEEKKNLQNPCPWQNLQMKTIFLDFSKLILQLTYYLGPL